MNKNSNIEQSSVGSWQRWATQKYYWLVSTFKMFAFGVWTSLKLQHFLSFCLLLDSEFKFSKEVLFLSRYSD